MCPTMNKTKVKAKQPPKKNDLTPGSLTAMYVATSDANNAAKKIPEIINPLLPDAKNARMLKNIMPMSEMIPKMYSMTS